MKEEWADRIRILADITQLVEYYIGNVEVTGSTPVVGSTFS